MLKKYKNWFIFFLLVYLGTFGAYYAFTVNIPAKTFFLQMRRYIPCALSVTITTFLWCHYNAKKVLATHAPLAIIWGLLYPFLYYVSYGASISFADNNKDFVFASYAYTSLVLLHLLLLKVSSRKIAAGIISFLQLIAATIPLLQIWYYFTYKSVITMPAVLAMLQTNPNEAREYIMMFLGYGGIACAVIGILLFYFLLFWQNKKTTEAPSAFGLKLQIVSLVLILATSGYGISHFRQTGVANLFMNTVEYFTSSNEFKNNHNGNFAQLTITPAKPGFKEPSTVIFVIGESASKNYCSAFGYTKHDTTPWMKKVGTSPNGFLFDHAYACWGQTVPSLERVLTEKNQYNEIAFNNTVTIMDVAKKAGYTTSWFSNQGIVGGADTPITLVAKTADHSAWIEETLKDKKEKVQYDYNLLEYVKKLDPGKNNFVVLHIMGSHENYINRYPASFTKWGTKGVYDMLDNYDNSLYYTDYVLQEVFQYAKEHLHLQAMMYMSDHGNNPNRHRAPDPTGFVSYRVPFFLYLSPEYETLYPTAVKIFRQHENSYFTTDLFYDTFCDILQVKSNRYEAGNSLGSAHYKWTKDTLKTRLGKTSLAEDKSPDTYPLN
ncbi:MAG: phosphoethanolamine transferase [Acidaminococcaceae bacterium]|jgi:heptose-I-phosphate ethanolaminephosphotransferase|nr:phosphoethanolamine transferase [Acidaminococcaceae bacterium]